MALAAFKAIQVTDEDTHFTPLASTKLWNGTLSLTPHNTFHRPQDDRNSLAENYRSQLVAQSGSASWEGDVTYERIIDFLHMSVKGAITPVNPAGTRYTWTFTPSLTASNAQDSYTIEFGDDTQFWRMPGCIVTNFELRAALDEVMQGRADIMGGYPAKVTKTAGLDDTDLPANEVVCNKGKVWIDGTWANLGTTQISAGIVGLTVRIPSGVSLIKYLTGTLEPTALIESRRHYELELEIAMGTEGITEYDAWAADTSRAIRVQFDGPIIEGANPYRLQMDFFGKYTSDPELLDERDGESIYRLTLSTFSDGLGNEFEAVIWNEEAAL